MSLQVAPYAKFDPAAVNPTLDSHWRERKTCIRCGQYFRGSEPPTPTSIASAYPVHEAYICCHYLQQQLVVAQADWEERLEQVAELLREEIEAEKALRLELEGRFEIKLIAGIRASELGDHDNILVWSREEKRWIRMKWIPGGETKEHLLNNGYCLYRRMPLPPTEAQVEAAYAWEKS